MDEKKQIVDMITRMSGKYTPYQIFSDWVCISALTIQNNCYMKHNELWKKREKLFRNIWDKYGKEEHSAFIKMFSLLVMAFGEGIWDYLGEIYMEADCGSKATGQFFTPFHISSMCANLVIEKENDQIKMNEPSCGSGGLILAKAKSLMDRGIDYQTRMDVTAQDLDWNGVYMTYVQLSLCGIRAAVIQGSSLEGKNPEENILLTPRKMGVVL